MYTKQSYPILSKDWKTLNNNFTYHPPKNDQQQRYEELRTSFSSMARIILEQCPESRERSIALTELETSMFWSNAAIARNE